MMIAATITLRDRWPLTWGSERTREQRATKTPVQVPDESRSSREHVYVGVDMFDAEDKTVSTDHDDTATVWPQAGNDA
jgi:hypothetical protein